MPKKKIQKALRAAAPRRCECIYYEPSEGDTPDACYACGHSGEEHGRDGCEGELAAGPSAVADKEG